MEGFYLKHFVKKWNSIPVCKVSWSESSTLNFNPSVFFWFDQKFYSLKIINIVPTKTKFHEGCITNPTCKIKLILKEKGLPMRRPKIRTTCIGFAIGDQVSGTSMDLPQASGCIWCSDGAIVGRGPDCGLIQWGTMIRLTASALTN